MDHDSRGDQTDVGAPPHFHDAVKKTGVPTLVQVRHVGAVEADVLRARILMGDPRQRRCGRGVGGRVDDEVGQCPHDRNVLDRVVGRTHDVVRVARPHADAGDGKVHAAHVQLDLLVAPERHEGRNGIGVDLLAFQRHAGGHADQLLLRDADGVELARQGLGELVE